MRTYSKIIRTDFREQLLENFNVSRNRTTCYPCFHSRRPKAVLALWLSCAVSMLVLPLAARAQSAGIIDLGDLNGGNWSQARGVSADGAVTVGGAEDLVSASERAFRWTQAGGMQSLGALNGGDFSRATGVSADGAVVVGIASDGAAGDDVRAFRWTQAGGMQSLGVLNGGQWSRADGVSSDGAVVVGAAIDGAAANAQRAFRWTEVSGMVSLGTLNGGEWSEATAASADGAVVVGTSQDGAAANVQRAFRWTQADGMQSLGVLNGGFISFASGVSADGAVVVGYADDGAAASAWQAFRWTQAGGMQSLGSLNGGTRSFANGVSADGAVVVGDARDGDDVLHGFRWTQTTGMQSVEDWLRAAGVAVASGIETYAATATNGDGSVVVGELKSGHAYIARVTGGGSGLVTVDDLQSSLGATASGGAMALGSSDLLINGAHSRPLSRRVEAGRNTFWVAGDWGRDDHGARDGDLGLAEIGLGRNFGPVQVNVSFGQTWAKQNLILGGSAKTDGTYLLAEALIPISGNLWATVGGYRHWGNADMKRGYLNAGVQDYSSGNPDVDTWSLRGRLELSKVYAAGGADFSPYVDLSYSEADLESYTESGGGFAARFNARKDKATELRLGANLEKPVGNARLVGLVEAAHRFEKDGPRTSGQVLGLFGFDFAGADNKQTWLRAGAGIEGKLAGGTASLMLNATSKGEVPNYWLAAGWQRTF